MIEATELVVRSVFIGIGATIVPDLWYAVLKRLFGVPSLSMRMLGRWAGHLPRGHFVHNSMAGASPVRGEHVIGWCAHYTIGVSYFKKRLEAYPALGFELIDILWGLGSVVLYYRNQRGTNW